MAKRLTSADRVNKGDRIRVTSRNSITDELFSEIYRVARAAQEPGFQRVYLVRLGSQPLAGRSGNQPSDWPGEAGFHFFDTTMLPAYEEPVAKRGGYELLEPDLEWVGDATTEDAVARTRDGRYIVRRAWTDGKLAGYDVIYGLGMSEQELTRTATIPAGKQFALEDAIVNGRVH